MPSVFDSLSTNGYFHDVVEKEVETMFLPWLWGEVEKGVGVRATARGLVDGEFFGARVSGGIFASRIRFVGLANI